ncbi:CD226 antigen isoform X2 [Takifugu rubripes]|uniref:CD226 molecule n=1 Tax=Takifugu rubripes TaxID=31033 RepID=A0A674N3W4_TAKRU|nr:CD226 antigen isoform X2 [Takifugu rubripes]|eukprot:XP_011616809.1 PREDICTED: CD226 antigen isoform X2 [Takifugu rubripes]
MVAVQRDHWYLMVLIIVPFLKDVVPQKDAVTVRLEEGMVLKCLCPWQGSFSMVSWTKPPNKDPIAVFHPELGMSFSHHYQERIEFLRSTPMDGSISLKNVTHQDIGVYHCSVQSFPQGSWTKSIQVEDLDEPPDEEEEHGDSSETQDVIRVDTELVAEQHSNATVFCNREHDNTVHNVTLERMSHDDQPWGVIGVCSSIKGGPVAQNYSDRGRLTCTDALNVRLHLTGVQQQDAGLYRCTWSTDGVLQTTTMLLRVQPTDTEAGGFSLSAYVMYIYIGAGVAGFILLIIFIVLTTKHMKQRNRVEYRVKLHPAQRPIHNFYENISVCPRKKPRHISECPIYVNLLTAGNEAASSRLINRLGHSSLLT